MKTSTTYKDAGVDIDAGNAFVEKIKPMVKSSKRPGLMGGLGGFGGLFDLKACGYDDPVLVSATDGVGTKLAIAQAIFKHDTIGIDLVAMCVNDLIVQGAEPLFFLDYFATGKLDVDEAADVVKGIAEGCVQAGSALIGGETAEMPAMYDDGKYDLAGFSVGAVERDKLLPRPDIAPGDVLIGLASSGLHSNGFSLVRHVIKQQGMDYASPCPWDASTTLGEALLEPTRIYVKPLLALLKSDLGASVKALAHITGGGLLENIPRILPEHCGAEINGASWQPPAVFDWVQQAGNIEPQEMLRTLNCGIGMVVVVNADKAESVTAQLNAAGETASVIGQIAESAEQKVQING